MPEKPIKTRLAVRYMLGLYGIVGIQASAATGAGSGQKAAEGRRFALSLRTDAA